MTKSPDDTRELAAAIATLVKPGDIILLAGDLGAGKTTFTQGFGRALGVDGPITSPTFTILHEYQAGTFKILHADVYRLERLQEVVDLGLAELIDGDDDAVALIEWGDAAEPVLPNDFLEIRLAYSGDEGEDDLRRLTFRTVGSAWAARTKALQQVLSRWSEEP